MDQTITALLNGVGVVGVVLLVGWLIWTGRLVTKPTHEEVTRSYREQLEKSESLSREQRILLNQLTEQNGILLESSVPTVNAVMSALHRAAGGDGR
jgi:hypothetical protein